LNQLRFAARCSKKSRKQPVRFDGSGERVHELMG
jgi:hypothetical protein